jgi:hypothetical protein
LGNVLLISEQKNCQRPICPFSHQGQLLAIHSSELKFDATQKAVVDSGGIYNLSAQKTTSLLGVELPHGVRPHLVVVEL